ncbi:MAG: DUF4238 domain-containing protein [Oceanibaculum nanhaiense]|uniref:DUF4238 domain-containing protein n=1 Tax=Oceanibaculum nanhaiense TaxID=1909734 RepID=UPI0025A35399|nr:DUF4238 domain-containing protein [Oceanibaculum nanhaiense]MDM7946408.1 DUF4238 domain-containing protein [Oceanibaculum nanhaiense]
MSSAGSKNHHYVPQNILKRFSVGDTDSVFVFDKHNKKEFRTNVRNILSENKFNDFLFNGREIKMEESFTFIENKLWDTYHNVVNGESLSLDNPGEVSDLAILMAFQFIRSKQMREMMRGVNNEIRENIRNAGCDPDEIDQIKEMSDDDVKFENTYFMAKNLGEFSEIISKKCLILFKTTEDNPFYIGDNPVSLHSHQSYGFYGNLGLGLSGIEIYMPLSKTLTLGALCPTIIDGFFKARTSIKSLLGTHKLHSILNKNYNIEEMSEKIKEMKTRYEYLDSMIDMYERGFPIICSPENVLFQNSLQVNFSHRYVLSSVQNFSLAREMIEKNPSSARGKLWELR